MYKICVNKSFIKDKNKHCINFGLVLTFVKLHLFWEKEEEQKLNENHNVWLIHGDSFYRTSEDYCKSIRIRVRNSHFYIFTF